jgi:hypothetical protein
MGITIFPFNSDTDRVKPHLQTTFRPFAKIRVLGSGAFSVVNGDRTAVMRVNKQIGKNAKNFATSDNDNARPRRL